MRSFRVLAAKYDPKFDRIEVLKEITNDDGSIELNIQSFASDVVEWRAAQYEIVTIDEAIDAVLHEPFIEEIDPLTVPLEELRMRHKASVRDAKVRLNGKSTKAKATVKAQLSMAGIPQEYIDAVDVDPMEIIKRHSHFSEKALQLKAKYIEESLEQAKKNQPRQQPTSEDRVKRLEAQLFQGKDGRKQQVEQQIKKASGILPEIDMAKKRRPER